MILSDRTLREQLAAGRIIIEPFDEACIQPSSIDVKISNLFRVFRNHTARVIDVKDDMTALTELVEIPADGVFMLHPGEFVLGSTLERVGVADDMVARIDGKALALGTEIPTPDGMRTMADLRVGDYVFSDTGVPVRIKDVTEVMFDRPCFELTFSDGTVLIADAGHQWVTTDKRDRRAKREGSIRTTEQIADSLEDEHAIHLAAPVDDARTLPRECATTLFDIEADAVDAHELACRLGMVATIEKVRTSSEIEDAPRYRVVVDSSATHRMITAVRAIPSVPVRCIEVDSSTGMYLATRSYIPTHNSSLGRLGLIIHSTAGFIDPGFDGHITLELTNIATLPITLYPGMKVGQVSFMMMTSPADNPYGKGARGSKYQGQRGPTPSRYFENFRD